MLTQRDLSLLKGIRRIQIEKELEDITHSKQLYRLGHTLHKRARIFSPYVATHIFTAIFALAVIGYAEVRAYHFLSTKGFLQSGSMAVTLFFVLIWIVQAVIASKESITHVSRSGMTSLKLKRGQSRHGEDAQPADDS